MRPRTVTGAPKEAAAEALTQVVGWYFAGPFKAWRERGAVPFYCDPAMVGHLAVCRSALAAGDEGALFQLFVALSMFQALRDVVILNRQRSLGRAEVESIVSLEVLTG